MLIWESNICIILNRTDGFELGTHNIFQVDFEDKIIWKTIPHQTQSCCIMLKWIYYIVIESVDVV